MLLWTILAALAQVGTSIFGMNAKNTTTRNKIIFVFLAALGICFISLATYRGSVEDREREDRTVASIVDSQQVILDAIYDMRTSSVDLGIRAELLAMKIRLFHNLWPLPEPPNGLPEPQRTEANRMWGNYLLSEYPERFLENLESIRNEFSEEGITDQIFDLSYQDPFNLTEVQAVADRLERMVETLRDK